MTSGQATEGAGPDRCKHAPRYINQNAHSTSHGSHQQDAANPRPRGQKKAKRRAGAHREERHFRDDVAADVAHDLVAQLDRQALEGLDNENRIQDWASDTTNGRTAVRMQALGLHR